MVKWKICSISANSIESCIVDNTKIKFQILKPMIVTGGLIISLSRMILFMKPESSAVCWQS